MKPINVEIKKVDGKDCYLYRIDNRVFHSIKKAKEYQAKDAK